MAATDEMITYEKMEEKLCFSELETKFKNINKLVYQLKKNNKCTKKNKKNKISKNMARIELKKLFDEVNMLHIKLKNIDSALEKCECHEFDLKTCRHDSDIDRTQYQCKRCKYWIWS
jgi:hypothetical protein